MFVIDVYGRWGGHPRIANKLWLVGSGFLVGERKLLFRVCRFEIFGFSIVGEIIYLAMAFALAFPGPASVPATVPVS